MFLSNETRITCSIGFLEFLRRKVSVKLFSATIASISHAIIIAISLSFTVVFTIQITVDYLFCTSLVFKNSYYIQLRIMELISLGLLTQFLIYLFMTCTIVLTRWRFHRWCWIHVMHNIVVSSCSPSRLPQNLISVLYRYSHMTHKYEIL